MSPSFLNVGRPAHAALGLSLLFPWALVGGLFIERMGGGLQLLGWALFALGIMMLVAAGLYHRTLASGDGDWLSPRLKLRENLETEGMVEPLLSVLLSIRVIQGIVTVVLLSFVFGFGSTRA